MSDRVYCTLAELLDDLDEPGALKEAAVMRYIRAASDYIDQKIGRFIPVTETRRYDGNGLLEMFIDLCLAVTSLTLDATAITSTQYLLYPRSRHWENGPYNVLIIDPDATELSCWTAERDVVIIVGRWGLYEDTEATGATVSSQSSSETSLAASSGAAVSPGAVLLIESEQELVTATGDPSDSTANTNEAVDISEEEIDVTDGTKVYTGETIRVDYEQMLVIGIKGNTLMVRRGYNGTAKATHSTSTDVYVYRTFTVSRGVNGTTAAAHSSKAISRYMAPYDVNWLARQMAGLMWKKARSGFAGKVGNQELGEVFYQNEFPEQIKQVRANYRIVRL